MLLWNALWTSSFNFECVLFRIKNIIGNWNKYLLTEKTILKSTQKRNIPGRDPDTGCTNILIYYFSLHIDQPVRAAYKW